ncbi:MAG: outer membrane beta-barrel protein, partial [Bradyrhizobium sp.]|nr:outer membrane beta-barrel protein [Bradyrhizobium sp.]
MSGPARGRRWRVSLLRALLPCLALTLAPIAFDATPGHAQTLTPDLFRPARDGFVSPQDSPLRRTSESGDRTGDAANAARLRDKDTPAKSRIGAIPTYGLPAASGASSSGYDSLNRTRKKAKFYPGQARPKPAPGPGSKPPQPLPANGRVRLSVPPSDSANKTPIPPAMAGTVAGQPPRKRLKVDDDPFGAVGDYAGSFLIKSAVELRGGFDTNPRRTVVPKGSAFYVVAPDFLAVSDWQRHAVVADLRGSFTGYGKTFPPPTDGTISSALVVIDRPDFTGHVDGRL